MIGDVKQLTPRAAQACRLVPKARRAGLLACPSPRYSVFGLGDVSLVASLLGRPAQCAVDTGQPLSAGSCLSTRGLCRGADACPGILRPRSGTALLRAIA